MEYIEWDNLKNIPFLFCQVVEDEENKIWIFTIWANVSCTTTTMWATICGLLLSCSAGLRTAQPTGLTCTTSGRCATVCVRTIITA